MTSSLPNRLTVQVASVPDREGIVTEVWLDQEQLAELRHERDGVLIEIYPGPDGRPWEVSYEALIATLQHARIRLNGNAPTDASTEQGPERK
jgi:hypothetical protein